MINKYNTQYWERYYKKVDGDNTPSTFSNICVDYMKPGESVLDICCGNGRDSDYFAKEELNVTGIDLNNLKTDVFEYKNVDISKKIPKFSLDKKFDNVYCRFMLHSFPENLEDYILINSNNVLNDNGLLFIEARSNKGEQPEKEDHYRRLIDIDVLKSKLLNINFEIVYEQESADLSISSNDNPVLLRLIVRKKGNIQTGSNVPFGEFHETAGQLNFKNAEYLLKTTKKILDANDIKFLLAFGTLLGAYRDGSFIEHDEDVDVAILDKHRQQITSLIIDGYFKLYGLDFIRNDINILYSLSYDNDYIDFYFFRDTGMTYKCNIYDIPKIEFDFTSPIWFLGEKFQSFNYVEKFLEDRYGSNWRTPIPNKPAI